MDITQLVANQKRYFGTGATASIAFRREMLDKLYQSIQRHQADICQALSQDLGKSDYEGFMCEIGMTLTEISYLRKHLKAFAKPKRAKTPLAQFPARSYQLPCPYGNVLIMSPWNYPLLLTLEPLADAIAAGNTAIVKPSAYSPATSAVVERILTECFPAEYVAVVTGGRQENASLLQQKFDMIFFTGSQTVGKEVLRHAAEYLTPVVLELGGKSPCIVDETANISLAARRIVFGKYLNCGQTCVAPDYILCQESIKDKLVAAIQGEIIRQFGENPLENPDYGHIISEKHFRRILGLMDSRKVVYGGQYDAGTRKIAPTVMDNVTQEDAVMGEEIFGPVLPVLTYKDFDSIYSTLADKAEPLALYLFSEDKARIEAVTHRIRYGGGCVNDCIIHLATSEMPFGGVGESGMGSYHGKAGFDAFSHTKAIVDKKTWLDLPMRYQPYHRKLYFKMLRFIMK